MQEQFETVGGTAPSDSELVRRIRAAAQGGGRAAGGPFGTPAPDGPARVAEEALNEFHQRHYAAVLAYARNCCRSSQASADLAKEAIDRVLREGSEPGEGSPASGRGADPAWRHSLLAAVRDTAVAWHRTSRNTELRDDFASWLARQPGEVPLPADGAQRSTGGEPTAATPPLGTVPAAGGDGARRSWFSPARVGLLAAAVAVLAGTALTVGPLLGPARDDAADGAPGRSGHASAPAPGKLPTASPGETATASASPSESPSPSHSKASKHPSARPPSPSKPPHPTRSAPDDKPPAGHAVPLAARPWTSQKYSFAPIRPDSSIDGHPLTIQGTPYSQGLGAHAYSEITYELGGTCTALNVDVGLDDEVGANGSVVFQVYRDGTKVADSGLMTVDQAAQRLTADLTGGSRMRLVVTDGGNGNDSDHADWGNPVLTCR
ncbi:NPCBM/NEW2 domain-containing protein [Streptomyces sp. NPDC048612]|uniref:NPCBM/NEW2 domain-containing protein n=1 Tax=Streptomyces sp. NPDC048612 TaxID=3365579 RepID=UPI00371E80E2